ncbi:MAG TPA: glycosyltransferase family 39 protein, partial [Phototrophicaceae bacterium]|nr:glycosyltransferase family 39 protein [Phototrophicaceae bacterium]
MSNRVSYTLAVLLLLLAAALRFSTLATLPPGFSNNEINDLRIAETVRQGRVEVFYNLNGQGREGLYQALLAAATTTGGGLVGYRVVSVWIGLITLALVYILGKRLFGTLAGLAALALLAVSMFPIVLARSIAPETMLPLYVTAVLLALSLSLSISETHAVPRTAAFGALGVLLGLGFYLHPESILVAVFSLLFIAILILVRRPAPRHMISFTWFALVVMVVIATPYVISSLQRPGLAAAGRLLVDDPSNGFLQSLGAGFN